MKDKIINETNNNIDENLHQLLLFLEGDHQRIPEQPSRLPPANLILGPSTSIRSKGENTILDFSMVSSSGIANYQQLVRRQPIKRRILGERVVPDSTVANTRVNRRNLVAPPGIHDTIEHGSKFVTWLKKMERLLPRFNRYYIKYYSETCGMDQVRKSIKFC
ncbi:uncharacterized protein LOC114927856 [Nylanderia fulva]|uniref:uncharacterized protein LOC114927856 n=1 Tax=Nylanderia fulva TaxID=613905 RepID=UPI0010FAD1C1|nr:uncharacterized protein LOC114927856 [Nylanderia fulva]